MLLHHAGEPGAATDALSARSRIRPITGQLTTDHRTQGQASDGTGGSSQGRSHGHSRRGSRFLPQPGAELAPGELAQITGHPVCFTLGNRAPKNRPHHAAEHGTAPPQQPGSGGAKQHTSQGRSRATYQNLAHDGADHAAAHLPHDPVPARPLSPGSRTGWTCLPFWGIQHLPSQGRQGQRPAHLRATGLQLQHQGARGLTPMQSPQPGLAGQLIAELVEGGGIAAREPLQPHPLRQHMTDPKRGDRGQRI